MAKIKKKEPSESAKYFRDNAEAREKKNAYNKEYHSSEERKKYRAFLNKVNRRMGPYGNGDGMDFDHSERKMIPASKNRAKK